MDDVTAAARQALEQGLAAAQMVAMRGLDAEGRSANRHYHTAEDGQATKLVPNRAMGTLRRALDDWSDGVATALLTCPEHSQRGERRRQAEHVLAPILDLMRAVFRSIYSAAADTRAYRPGSASLCDDGAAAQGLLLPLQIADWLSSEFVVRFSGRSRSTFRGLLVSAGIFVGDIADGERQRRIAAQPTGSATIAERDTRRSTGATILVTPPLPVAHCASDIQATAQESSTKTASAVAVTTTARAVRGGSDSRGEREEGQRWKMVVRNRRTEMSGLGDVLAAIFDTANVPRRTRVTLDELWQLCVAANVFDGDRALHNAAAQRRFSRAAFTVLQRDLPPRGILLAQLGDGTIVDIEAERGATLSALSLMSPESLIRQTGEFDDIFTLLLHLLDKNFHIKPISARDTLSPPSAPDASSHYPGHNICCVAVDPHGEIVGFDFNQCKFDQNLCSHAEKRLAEAINESLKPTVSPDTPPKLDGYAFISSLEPCHMCSNFISRMGVKRIGFLMRDPMQQDALFVAARMLGLEVHRPRDATLFQPLEEALTVSGLPLEEITTFLGSLMCRDVIHAQVARLPLADGSSAARFARMVEGLYPGAVLSRSTAMLEPSSSSLVGRRDVDDGMSVELRSTSDLLLESAAGSEGDEDDADIDDNTPRDLLRSGTAS